MKTFGKMISNFIRISMTTHKYKIFVLLPQANNTKNKNENELFTYTVLKEKYREKIISSDEEIKRKKKQISLLKII